MKTNIQTTATSNFHTQTTSKASKGKWGLVMALVLLSGTQLAVSADFTLEAVPQRQHIPSELNEFQINTIPPIPSTESYQACLSEAVNMIANGKCNDNSYIVFCLKSEFAQAGSNCAYYL